MSMLYIGMSLDTGSAKTCDACRELKPYAAYRKIGRGEFADLLRWRCRDCEEAKRPIWTKAPTDPPTCVHEQVAWSCRLCRLERAYARKLARRTRRRQAVAA